ISHVDLASSLKEGKGAGTSARRQWMRGALVVAEVALSLVLLTAAGLMLRSFLRLQQIDLGIQTRNLLTLQISLPGARYREAQQLPAFYRQLIDRVKALPGVRS